jgi:hexosaminidase
MPKMSRKRPPILALAVALMIPAMSAVTASAAPHAPTPPQIVPKPVSTSVGQGEFTLERGARIVVQSAAALPVAQALAGYLRPATGYALPVVTGQPAASDLSLVLRDPGTLGADRVGEGYQLTTSPSGLTLEAKTPHGLYNGVQTVRQLLPPWIDSSGAVTANWTMPVVRISDYPRYGYRGVMLDIARHFEPPSAVMQLIDQAAAYKINTLHLHVSDDQGFRIAMNGFPNLTEIGSQGSVGTGGRAMDPGGFWTQDEYRSVVAYAAAHFMTVVPEVDTPGHNNAIIMSEYNDTTNPLLDGNPQDINCGKFDPPMWNFTGAVGYSAMCPESNNTWTILGAIIDQLTAMSPGPYYHLGGDEVPSTLLSQDRYAALVNREGGIVNGHGKTAMGWAEIAGPGTALREGSVAEYWNPASGSTSGTVTATEAVQKKMKIVMAPANHTYLDQKYASHVPPNLGLTWACGSAGCDVDKFYNWDPGSYVDSVTDANVIGVEGAMWAETVVTLSDVDYMVFPRLPALAELGWSPLVARTASGPAYKDFLGRLAAQGARFMTRGTNFYPSPKVPWRLDLVAAHPAVSNGQVSGALATLSAPGFAPDAVAATIDWGDGTTTPGTVTGTAATPATVNSLYGIGGDHLYATSGTHHATVTVTAPGVAPATVRITLPA